MKYFIFFVFILGMLYYLKPVFKIAEGFESKDNLELSYAPNCPTLLLEKDSKFYLYNKNKPQGKNNPIIFNNLEDYSNFVKRENKRGNICPILFLQQSYNTQGEREFKIRPSPTDLQGGAPPIHNEQFYTNLYRGTELLTDSGMNDKPYNANSYPSFDPMNQDIGKKTPLDMMDLIQQTKEKSPNPEDPNWGGHAYTQSLIDAGVYDDNGVKIWVSNS